MDERAVGSNKDWMHQKRDLEGYIRELEEKLRKKPKVMEKGPNKDWMFEKRELEGYIRELEEKLRNKPRVIENTFNKDWMRQKRELEDYIQELEEKLRERPKEFKNSNPDWMYQKRELEEHIRELEEKLRDNPKFIEKTQVINSRVDRKEYTENPRKTEKEFEYPETFFEEQIKDFETGVQTQRKEKVLEKKDEDLLSN